MPFPFMELGEGAVLAWLGVSRVLDRNRRKKKEELERKISVSLKLKANPERCGDHENRLRAIETKMTESCTKLDNMKEDISEIKADIREIKENKE